MQTEEVEQNGETAAAELHHEVLLQYVERFAAVFEEAGMTRMSSRVFAYILAEDAEMYTAAELARGLRVSLAAISGAVRYLVNIGVVAKVRLPGSRSDHYRIFDADLWGKIFEGRSAILLHYRELAGEALDILPAGSAGWRRMRETREFFDFMVAEWDGLMARWQEHRRKLELT